MTGCLEKGKNRNVSYNEKEPQTRGCDEVRTRVTVFTDYRFMTSECPTGVAKHAYFMAKGLAQDPSFEVSALSTSDQFGRLGKLSFLPSTRIGLPWMVSRELWTWLNCPAADRWMNPSDWVYCPKNDWIPVKNAKYAVTFHGANELDPTFNTPNGLRERFNCCRTRKQYQVMCERADKIFTVSVWLKQFMVEKFHSDPNKYIVVGNGVDPVFYEAGKRRRQERITGRQGTVSVERGSSEKVESEPPFILCLGGLNYIDGGDRIVALAELLRRSDRRWQIKVAGQQHEPEWVRKAEQTGKITLLGYVPHERLATQMANAAAFYFPTRYETFGMGAAEAMAAGCPVVTSRCTAVPEVVGDGGIYVEPDRAAEVIEALDVLVGDEATAHALREKAFERATRFTWEACIGRLSQALTVG